LTLRTLTQAGAAKANELFTTLSETSDGALKTREKLFAELKTELNRHADLKQQHLFPALKKHADTKELVAAAASGIEEVRAKLAELDALPKNHETFLANVVELRKLFRQHVRNETKELLPAVQKALGEEQVQELTEKIESSLAEAERTKHDDVGKKRAAAQQEGARAEQERQQAEQRAQQEAAAKQKQQEAERRAREAAEQERQQAKQRAQQEAAAKQKQQEAERRAREAAEQERQQAKQRAQQEAAAKQKQQEAERRAREAAEKERQQAEQRAQQEAAAGAQAQLAGISDDQSRRSVDGSAGAANVHQGAAENMQVLLGSFANLGRGLERYQRAYLDLLNRSMESMVHRQQDLLRARSPVQFAELQRTIYLESVDALFTYRTTLLNIAGEIARDTVQPLQERARRRGQD